MELYKGIGADGNGIIFLHGDEPDLDSFAKGLESYTGQSFGTPQPGTIAYKIADVTPDMRVSTVCDLDGVLVKEDDKLSKPEGGRKPTGNPGTWTIQSLVFAKSKFDKDQAAAWVGDHDQFGNFGIEENDTSYRFRQYDPSYFVKDKFRMTNITDGVRAVYGLIADKATGGGDEAAVKALIDDDDAIRALAKDSFASSETEFAKSLLQDGAIGWAIATKADEERGIATGIVLEPNDGEDGTVKKPDAQNEIFSRRVVEDTAFDWLANGGAIDFMHSFESLHKEEVHVVETWTAREMTKHGDYNANPGTWFMSARFDTAGAFWKGIKEGKLQAWSPGGLKRTVDAGAEEGGNE